MFPESHAFAFGVTAYQAAWLKRHYPLEFFVGLFNEQPMGFYNLETLKEDARRHGITILHPDINRSMGKSVIDNEAIRLGFLHVKGIGGSNTAIILRQRDSNGTYLSVGNFMERTGLQLAALENLVDAGAFDLMGGHRRDIRWEMGLRYRPVNRQISLSLPINQDIAELPKQTTWEEMVSEYKTMGIYPKSHIMTFFRPQLEGTVTSLDIPFLEDGAKVWVGGVLIRKQRPLGRAVFITLEDEYGHIPLMVFPNIYARYKDLFHQSLLIVRGTVSRKDGTMNIQVTNARHLTSVNLLTERKNWR
jgi:error-prone DNA polymerase